MIDKKAYFVDSVTEEVYELPIGKVKLLNKLHPDWVLFNIDNNPIGIRFVEQFFMTYGKLVATPRWKNVFVGMTV